MNLLKLFSSGLCKFSFAFKVKSTIMNDYIFIGCVVEILIGLKFNLC